MLSYLNIINHHHQQIFKKSNKTIIFPHCCCSDWVSLQLVLPEDFPDSRLNQVGSLLLVLHLVDAVEDKIVLPGLVQLVQFILIWEGLVSAELRDDKGQDTCRSSRAFSIPFILLEVSWVEEPSWLRDPVNWDLMPSISFCSRAMVSSDSF